MLKENPNERICMADIIGHPWLNGPIATEGEVRANFAARQATIQNQANDNFMQRIAQNHEAINPQSGHLSSALSQTILDEL